MVEKSKRSKKQFTKDFRVEAAKLVVEQGMTQAEVSKDLGINGPTLSRWVQQYRESGVSAFPGKGRLRPEDQRIKDLEAQVRRLTMERDILKKATAYFAKLPE